jgi:hypothetical protein
MITPLQSVGDLVTNVVSDPLSIVLALLGALLIGFSMAVLGYLTLGAVLDAVLPDVSPGQPPRAR